jgi:hypothetical protein
MNYIVDLKQRVLDAEERVAYLESLLETFFTGDVPNGASLNHFVLAKWGRKRLEEQKSTAALLRTDAA